MLRLSLHECLYFIVSYCCVLLLCAFSLFSFYPRPLTLHCAWFPDVGVFVTPFWLADGASRSTQNLASTAWAIYAPTNELISLHGVFLGRATNNIAEYSAVIELLTNAISLGIRRLVIRLDSQLVVLQLSNVYAIRSPTLLRVYLRIRLLERYFDYIEYQHIPRCLNTLTDALANYVLDRHLRHL
jgi:ribonuclease HI